MEISAKTLHFIEEHREDDTRTLALQSKKYPDVDMAAAVTQIAGRQVAARKLPSLWYPPHLSMEQCSSEATALYKASLLEGDTFADLTGGFGIDCSFISRNFKQADYVERQTELCELALHNFPLLGLGHIRIHNRDGVAYLQEMLPVDCLFLDPARRDGHGGKTVAISDCEPDVSALESLLVDKAKKVMVKLSPMLDMSLAYNECKELLLILQKEPVSSEISIHCEHIAGNGESQHYTFTLKQEKASACPLTDQVGTYLYEPNVAILKAGAFRSLTQTYPVMKLHLSSHLYTSASLVPDFPGRRFRVESVSGFGKKELKAFLKDMDKANITIRNFPLSVAELRRRLKLKEGGDDYIFATTLSDERKVLIRARKC